MFLPVLDKFLPDRSVDPIHPRSLRPRSYRSPAASPRRHYGPFILLSKAIIKTLFLGFVGLVLSVLLFAVLGHESSVLLLQKLSIDSWKPLIALVLAMLLLAAIEESFS